MSEVNTYLLCLLSNLLWCIRSHALPLCVRVQDLKQSLRQWSTQKQWGIFYCLLLPTSVTSPSLQYYSFQNTPIALWSQYSHLTKLTILQKQVSGKALTWLLHNNNNISMQDLNRKWHSFVPYNTTTSWTNLPSCMNNISEAIFVTIPIYYPVMHHPSETHATGEVKNQP